MPPRAIKHLTEVNQYGTLKTFLQDKNPDGSPDNN